jgi:hypothetical protein
MTQKECTALLVPLALAMQAEFDGPTQRAYFRALEDVPARLLTAAVERVGRSGARFFPKATELRQFAEDARKSLIASVKYEPCAQCNETGWETVLVENDQPRVRRCACWKRHQEKVAQLGVGHQPVALPEPEYIS